MKKNWLIIVVAILMSASVNSQVLLKKTLWNNENAFIGNEAAMDSISETYMKLEATLSDNASYKLKFQLADRKSTRLNSSHVRISYAVFCLKKKNNRINKI